jgi:hypothetical protein
MKLVQMPVELLHVDEERLPSLGVDERLLAGFGAYRSGLPDGPLGEACPAPGSPSWATAESVAILAPPEAGTRELLMVLARRVGAALRDENIGLRDRGGDLKGERKKLCYLPGRALPEALGSPSTRRALEREAACFVQDLDEARGAGGGSLDPSPLLDVLDARRSRGLPTFLSADPAALPNGLERELRARMRVLEES